EVAPRRAEGQDGRAGQEVVEGLLLDRVDAEAGRPPVGQQDDAGLLLALAPLRPAADEADAPLARPQLAGPGADVALHPTVGQLVPVPGRDHRRTGAVHATHANPATVSAHRGPGGSGTPLRRACRPPCRRRSAAHDDVQDTGTSAI